MNAGASRPDAAALAAPDVAMLDELQRAAFDYFVANANPVNGLVSDTSREGSRASIAVRVPSEVVVDFAAVMARMRRIRERLSRVDTPARLAAAGIDLYFGRATFVGRDAVEVGGSRLRFDKALIATGSRALLPEIKGLTEAGFLTNESVFDLETLRASLLVVGGGPLGCELAQAFARFGARTLISHREPLFLLTEERDAAQMVADSLAHDGVEIHLNSQSSACAWRVAASMSNR